MGFWILAITAAVGIVLVLAYALLSPARDTAKATAEFDMNVYRDQLKELKRDVARGVISDAEAKLSEVEISRRLLEADKARDAASTPRGAPSVASVAGIIGIAVVVLGGGAWMYSELGAPGYADLPLQERKDIAATAAENRPPLETVLADMPEWSGPAENIDPDYVRLVEQLRTAVARRPQDVQGLKLLAQHEAQLGNFRAAFRAQDRLIDAMDGNADATDYAELAELMVLATNGYVSPEAEEALRQSLERDPENGIARYYTGLMFAQGGRPDLAFRMWRVLYETSDPTAPWMELVAAELPGLAAAAGVNYTLPDRGVGAGLPGPSVEDMGNAADMTPDERQEMIQGMVSQLMERLANEGGTAPEWARLISSLGMLGDTDRAAAIWGKAQGRFGARPDDLDIIRQAAVQAGVAEPVTETLSGPTAEDMENAADMSDVDRQGMIKGMVDRLSERIDSEGGTAEEWARLISSLGVMGETRRAAQFWEDAQKAFWDDPEGLEVVRAAAERAGVTE